MLLALRFPGTISKFVGVPTGGFVSRNGIQILEGTRGWSFAGLDVSSIGVETFTTSCTDLPEIEFGIDHIVLLVPNLTTIKLFGTPKKQIIGPRNRPTAFYILPCGKNEKVLLEVIEEATVSKPLLWGFAFDTERPLSEVADEISTKGGELSKPRPAFQGEGREIMTITNVGKGLGIAVITKRRSSKL
jgi:hypothetical protein